MKILIMLFFLALSNYSFSQQVADTTYHPKIYDPLYETGKGPVVFIDEGHHNFHTKNGRYKAFANLLERDGYKVKAYQGNFDKQLLSEGNILVISNALNEINVNNWDLPNPSAFSESEIEVVTEWVRSGGSLFLIADHMPMAGAASDLALEFGFEFTNGFVFDTINRGPAYFNLKEKTLTKSVITKGRSSEESVAQIVTFTGQAFKIPDDATPVLTFDKKFVNMLPNKAWVFDDTTTRFNVEGWSQGAFKNYGKGRVVVFGEAAMFSAQLAGENKRKMGMNNEVAPENYQLLLNIIHWLDNVME
ncbi:DUF4350 domain-containing protein [Lutimonas saemankumensis]|uniref:DUF4350 domain-containing protein n=1 Tax=Lutimonas saemankumensis TaxID=483016 RepID=UPI001CD34A4F|nr:DUF4350 domain-containing protein [Lutimonas saemankumensis]MCA0931335.1 DUF4350 domain-containing protein [Lutimonas saemankumensis]